MSDEFESSSQHTFSSFWPLLILIAGLFIWFAMQDYLLNNQRNAYNKQFQDQNFLQVVGEAQNVSKRYVNLMQDLLQTAQKDQAAADIVKAAISAGLIHVNPAANGAAGTNAPAATPPAK